jgi:hypothetical protein
MLLRRKEDLVPLVESLILTAWDLGLTGDEIIEYIIAATGLAEGVIRPIVAKFIDDNY